MLREQAPTLKVPGVDFYSVGAPIAARYCNPALRHRTGRLRDGWQPENFLRCMLTSVPGFGILPIIAILILAGAGRARGCVTLAARG